MCQDNAQDTRFDWVHSFYVESKDTEDTRIVAATCDYGLEFCSVIHQKNLFATQFPPEKIILPVYKYWKILSIGTSKAQFLDNLKEQPWLGLFYNF